MSSEQGSGCGGGPGLPFQEQPSALGPPGRTPGPELTRRPQLCSATTTTPRASANGSTSPAGRPV